MEYNSDIFLQQAAELLDEADGTAALANVSALLKLYMPEANWTGFYLVKDDLTVGPFQGKPACTHIPFSKGVCGRCWREKKAQRVDDVMQVKDHIACDSESRSELCVPVMVKERVVILIDLDAPVKHYFTEEHEKCMCRLALLMSEAYTAHAWVF